MDDRPGCLVGLLKLSLLRWAYDGLQRTFGWKSGSCMGCGCGLILFIMFIGLLFSIVFGTDWFKLVSAFGMI
jgi:hypothetical protein